MSIRADSQEEVQIQRRVFKEKRKAVFLFLFFSVPSVISVVNFFPIHRAPSRINTTGHSSSRDR
jgi:hypothetical protein